MNTQHYINGLSEVGRLISEYYNNKLQNAELKEEFSSVITNSSTHNSWFTVDSIKYALQQWAEAFQSGEITSWLSNYELKENTKRVGLILAGNIPMVGWHDVMSVLLSGHYAVIKLSTKDKYLIPFLLKLWNDNSEKKLGYEFVERLENFDAVIATGSNNTARYLEYYFKKYPHIIRKNRTSVGVLLGDETDDELQLLAHDIFRYYGLGCRNVSKLFLPKDMKVDRLFENFLDYQSIINHNSYANNYEYNRAIYLMNQEKFWDNNFVMLKEDEQLFGPLSVINFSRYESIDEVENFIDEKRNQIQCVVCKEYFTEEVVPLGKAQEPKLTDYADHIDIVQFLSDL